jgi:hypothetical protein
MTHLVIQLLRVVGLVLCGLRALALLAAGGVYLNAQRVLAQRPDNPVATLAVASTPGQVAVKGWTDAEFIRTLRQGVDPAGHALNPLIMPWPQFGRATDDDLKALHQYLTSLP